MMTRARIRKRNWRKENISRIATWNIKSLNNRDQEIIEELKERKIDLCALQETKKKGNGQKDYGDYVLVYSGVDKGRRAVAGVGILIHSKYKDSIEDCVYHSERILKIKLTTNKLKINVISVYSPEDCKPKEERETFYDSLQEVLDTILPEEAVIIMGDFNARIGNTVISGTKQRFHEAQSNDNGELMVNLCSLNNLRINNTFYDHKETYKYTFENSRGQKSMIDYIVTNRNVLPSQIIDVRTLNSANVGSDHKLLLGKIRLRMTRSSVKDRLTGEDKFNVEALWDESTKSLYQQRLATKISADPISDGDDLEYCWEKLKNQINEAAKEALGTRKIKPKRGPSKTPWFRNEIKVKCEEKRRAHLDYLTLGTSESLETYKRIRNETKDLVRRTKNEHWENFSKRLESDFYGQQKQMWRFIRQQRKEVNELVGTNQIEESTWIEYLTELFRGDSTQENGPQNITINESTTITAEEVKETLKKIKNRKSPGQDGIPNELLKYGGESLVTEITSLANKILLEQRIPSAWKTSTMILMFKRGDKKEPNNYRGINLLDAMFKVITKIFTTKITSTTTLAEEQQGFRTGRSCTDAVFVMRQVVEKSIEYNRPAFLCFVDLHKAFDRVRLEDIINMLYNRGIPTNLVRTIRDVYSGSSIQVRMSGKLSEKIPVNSGIRQGDSLSPLLFNIMMDEIIRKVKTGRGYRMGDQEFTILCYADDAVLFAESEDDLQRNLQLFNDKAKELNMIISAQKTKCMTTAKVPLRCKLEVNQKIVEQVMEFSYLGVELSSFGDLEREVSQQVVRANKIAGCLNDSIWRNGHLNLDTKSRIYRSTIRPIMAYTAETRPDTTRTKRMLETAEMKILRRIAGKTLFDRERSDNIRRMCNVENIGEWIQSRKREWNAHIERMGRDRIVKGARDRSPSGKRSPGRPRKRWSDSLRPE